MEFKYALSVMFSHMGYVLKVAIWILIVVLISIGIGVAVFLPIADLIAQNTSAGLHFDSIVQSVNSFASGTMSIKALGDSAYLGVNAMFDAVFGFGAGVAAIFFGITFVYFIGGFMLNIASFNLSVIFNNILSSNMRIGFVNTLIMNLKKACQYALAKTLFGYVFDAIFAIIFVALGFALFKALSIVSFPIMLVLFALYASYRSLVFADWLPRLMFHGDEKIFIALSRSLSFIKRNYKGFLKIYIISYITSYLIMSAVALPTCGLIFIIMPACYMTLLRIAELIGHYKVKGLKFYVDATTVINTVEFGFRKIEKVDDEGSIEDIIVGHSENVGLDADSDAEQN